MELSICDVTLIVSEESHVKFVSSNRACLTCNDPSGIYNSFTYIFKICTLRYRQLNIPFLSNFVKYIDAVRGMVGGQTLFCTGGICTSLCGSTFCSIMGGCTLNGHNACKNWIVGPKGTTLLCMNLHKYMFSNTRQMVMAIALNLENGSFSTWHITLI